MRIVQIIARVNKGGTARWLEVLVTELRSLGHEVELLAGHVSENELEDPIFATLGGLRFEGLGRSISIKKDLATFFALRRYLREHNPDVLNTHTAKAGVLGRLASIGLGIKVVHTYHGHLLYGYFSPVKTKILIRLEIFLGHFTNVFIAVGNQVKSDLIKAGIGESKKYLVINPGIPIIKLTKASEARKKFGFEEKEPIVGWLGRLTAIKRPDRVVELANSMPQIKFAIGGEGELSDEIKANAPRNLVVLGWISPEDFWSACDVALLTSDNEGLPTSLIEAAFSMKPIVCEDVGSASEIFEDRKGGFLVSNFETRRRAVISLTGDRELALKMGRNAQEYALNKFSIERFVNMHMQAYSQAFTKDPLILTDDQNLEPDA